MYLSCLTNRILGKYDIWNDGREWVKLSKEIWRDYSASVVTTAAGNLGILDVHLVASLPLDYQKPLCLEPFFRDSVVLQQAR